jgi:hypothetical protein
MNLFSKIIALLLICSSFSCSSPEKKPAVPVQKDTLLLTDSLNYTIIPLDKAGIVPPGLKPTDLTKDDLVLLDTLLSRCFHEQAWSKSRDLNQYKRQYIAGINEKGEKEIWVNCMCQVTENWRTEIPLIMDGGKCYFDVTINLTTKTYRDFGVGSEA